MYCNNLTLLIICLFTIVEVPARRLSHYDNFSARIVGGITAPPAIAPFQVSLSQSRSSNHFCSGSILNELWIVTAGHCLVGKSADEITVLTGTNLLSSGGQTYHGDEIIIHEEFNIRQIKNDIALLRLRSNIIFSSKVRPVKLAYEATKEDTTLIVTGWGIVWSPNGPSPDKLQMLNVGSIEVKTCRTLLERWYPIFDNQVCAYKRKGQGTCKGDSGGPLFQDGLLVGIVSWGVPCAKGYPDVYTSVFAFHNWITENMNKTISFTSKI